MDKFDEFLKQKACEEKQDYILPKSYEDKIEKTLDHLDDIHGKGSWYSSRKYLAIAAGFAFVMIIGTTSINSGREKAASPKMASESYSLNQNADKKQFGSENARDGANGREIIVEDNISSITIKSLGENSKYKNVNNENDINKILTFLQGMNFNETQGSIGTEWDFIIQINGEINSNIVIKENIFSVDDMIYEVDNWDKNSFINFYNELNYEEQDIKYCPIN